MRTDDGAPYARLIGGLVNVFAVAAQDGLTLVDAGTKGSLARLQRGLTACGWSLDDVRRVFVTHAHADHVGGLAELVDASAAQVIAHRLEVPFVRGGGRTPRPEHRSLRWPDRLMARLPEPPAAGVPVDRCVEEDDVLDDVAPGARVVHLPGHTPGQAGLWLPRERVLFGGDVALRLLPWRLSLPFAAFTTDMAAAIASIERAAALEPDHLALGHGPPLDARAGSWLWRLATAQGADLPPRSA